MTLPARNLGSKPAPPELALAQAFINTADHEKGTDEIDTPQGLRDWLTTVGLIDAATPVTQTDLAAAVGVREALRNLTLANNGYQTDPSALDTLNRAARCAQLAVSFRADGGAGLEPRAPGVDGALGSIIAVAFDAMANGTWARLKACPAETCLWAFYDETKNRSGTWCSMSVCGNRTKARTYRQRHTHAGVASDFSSLSGRIAPAAKPDSAT
ncbi:MAG TPA: CGNR zinc finger domain-containing protein [Candidatus Eremiobacteraceae bacterium]|nr:CGNR zinc finger domain-containing protein [Candidatus Eremiobacteraceae bacterium]